MIRKIGRRMLPGSIRRIASKLRQALDIHSQVTILLHSKHFNAAYYSESANLAFRAPRLAAAHYLLVGEDRGLRPSTTFDPACYIEANPDLIALPYPKLVHFIQHGVKEGRPASANLEGNLIRGRLEVASGKHTVVVVVHEMSRTGAPILGLNIVEALSKRMNVIVVGGRRGALLENFLNASSYVIAPGTGWFPSHAGMIARGILDPLKSEYGANIVIVNSAEVAAFSEASHLAGLPCVSLVHEFADYVFPRSKITNVIRGSQRVIFSSRLTEKTFREYWEFGGEVSNTCVIPQGKCTLPETIGHAKTNASFERLRRFGGALVIGCGQVQMRKGVGFFIATANLVVKTLGKDAVRFVWVGGGYAPDTDDYSRWLKSQLDRSELDDAFEFLGELGAADLEELYRIARVMLLSSRLDPFPNVAIDAMNAGLPVVCFENASGVAEYIGRVPGLEELVAPHMDVGGAAREIQSLIENGDRHERVSRALRALSDEQFRFDGYISKLVQEMDFAERAFAQEQKDGELILDSGLFDAHVPWVGHRLANREAIVRDYVRMSESGSFSAEPRLISGLNMQIYAQHHERKGMNPLAEWLKGGKPEGPWFRDVATIDSDPHASRLRVALHIHLHYIDTLEGILDALAVNATQPDVLITISSDEIVEKVQQIVSLRRIRARIVEVENRGRDIGPLITTLAPEWASYDVIAHVHGKKSTHIGTESFVDTWLNLLTQNVLGGEHAALDYVLQMFESDSRLGLVFPEDPFICGWGANKKHAEALSRRMNLGDLPKNIEFPVGNMFVARPAALRPLLEAGFVANDFPPEPVKRDGTMLHAIERLLPVVCEASGFTWKTTNVAGVER